MTGTVDSREAKRYAEEAVENCFGVKDVENRLKVKKEITSGRESGSGWGSEIDTSRTSMTSRPGETGQGTTMGDVRRGAGSPAGSKS